MNSLEEEKCWIWIRRAKKHVDTLIVIPNDKLLSDFKIETSNVKDIFTAPNEILYRAV